MQARHAARLPWRHHLRADACIGASVPWGAPEILRPASVGVVWQQGRADASVAAGVVWSFPALAGTASTFAWRDSEQVRVAAGLAWLYPERKTAQLTAVWADGERVAVDALATWLIPPQRRTARWIPWGEGHGLPWLVIPPAPLPPAPPVPGRLDGRYVGAELGCPAWAGPYNYIPARLGSIACYNVRPRRKVYVVRNEISIVRLPDRKPVDVTAGSITMDVDSWSLAVTLQPASAADLATLKPAAGEPRECEITINGHVFTCLIEDWSTDKRFAEHRHSVTGRSRTALLDEPYAPRRTRTEPDMRLAAQLVDAELADTGVTADYQTVDWTVPAGAWAYTDQTPIAAIQAVAAASGAVVQSDIAAKTLHIRPRYPVKPWAWAASPFDVTVTDDHALQITEKVVSKPRFDSVFVSAEAKGVMGFFKRSGEAGTSYAPQFVHPLISDATPHAEAGANILADRGRQSDWTFAGMPLYPEPLLPGLIGLLRPLQLAQVATAGETWVGLVTRNRIDFARSSDGRGLVVHQTANITRHPEDAN